MGRDFVEVKNIERINDKNYRDIIPEHLIKHFHVSMRNDTLHILHPIHFCGHGFSAGAFVSCDDKDIYYVEFRNDVLEIVLEYNTDWDEFEMRIMMYKHIGGTPLLCF